MTKAIVITIALFIVALTGDATLGQPTLPPHSTGPNAQLFDDSIIVKYKESVLQSSVPAQRKAKMNDIAMNDIVPGLPGITVIKTLPILGIQTFRLGQNQQIDIVIQALRNNPFVQYAEYNFRIVGEQSPPPRDPNDPQWLEGSFWGLKKIGMRSVWGYKEDASAIIVAVIDSGIDYTHPDLALNMYTDSIGSHGYNFCDDNDDPRDTIHHGTMVAGVIGARGNNNFGLVGTDWKVQLVALKALCSISDGMATGGVALALEAINWAVAIQAHVINNSWRVLPGTPLTQIQSLEDAVRKTNCEGPGIPTPCRPALFVAAAGNGRTGEPLNNDPCTGTNNPCGAGVYPANFGTTSNPPISNVISVAAMECQNFPSCTGNFLWSDSHFGSRTVHIAAPGRQIESTDLWLPATPWMSYASGEGTSMASPFVSGCAALLQAKKLSDAGTLLSIPQLKNLLFDNANTPFTGTIIGGRSLSCIKSIAAM